MILNAPRKVRNFVINPLLGTHSAESAGLPCLGINPVPPPLAHSTLPPFPAGALTGLLIRPVAFGFFDVVVESSGTVERLVDAVVAKVVDGTIEDVAEERLAARRTAERRGDGIRRG